MGETARLGSFMSIGHGGAGASNVPSSVPSMASRPSQRSSQTLTTNGRSSQTFTTNGRSSSTNNVVPGGRSSLMGSLMGRGSLTVSASGTPTSSGRYPPASRSDPGNAAGPGHRGSQGSMEPLWRPKNYWQRCRETCCSVVEHRCTVTFTTLLTVWVLIGEDVKMLTTNRPADFIFGVIGLICICVFSVEILLSAIGKKDYFPGFFFLLDLASSASLVLDLPWVSDAMNEDSDTTVVNGTQRGRTARIGARSARIVRVIRLVRIAKLYKAVYESSREKTKAPMSPSSSGRSSPGDDRDKDEEDGDPSESRVGKKLSDITTRRVIVLVLSMLIILPLLSADDSFKIPASANYGGDEIWIALKHAGPPGSDSRWRYEVTLLRYIFYHNWFTGNGACPNGKHSQNCPNTYDSHLYWVGFSGRNNTEVHNAALDAQVTQSTVEDYAANVSQQDEVYNYGAIPTANLAPVAAPWWDCPDSRQGMHKVGVSLLTAPIKGLLEYTVHCYQDLRATERTRYQSTAMSVDDYDDCHFEFWFDMRPFVRTEAAMSLGTTAFICVVLCGAAMLFYNDVNQLVLYPVEEMISKVQAIQDDPLKAVAFAELEYAKEVKTLASQSSAGRTKVDMEGLYTEQQPYWTTADLKEWPRKIMRTLACTTASSGEPMETVILEKTIIKLGSLLALGFGEAGAHIIAANMVGTSYGVNVMVPGQRVDCVIGHARIENFSVATEVLQSKVMTFVNQVAEIVHGVVEEHHGSANKNNGDTFLLIWRHYTSASDSEDVPAAGAEDKTKFRGQERAPVHKLADMSVLAFAKIISAVHRSSVLASYRGHPSLQNRLGSNYRVDLRCGLHFGWAIEGAVGSEYKIEASYLSPNVAVSVSVEEATHLYGVSFLASQAVLTLCSPSMRTKCRLIDCVLVPGSSSPLELYSIDLEPSAVRVSEHSTALPHFGAKLRMRARQFLEAEKRQKPLKDASVLFDEDVDIMTMRRSITEDFCELFRMGYQNYSQGEWQVARRFLEETYVMRGMFDGPSLALIQFMKAYRFEAPSGWKGIHDLSSSLHGGVNLGMKDGGLSASKMASGQNAMRDGGRSDPFDKFGERHCL